MDINTEFCVFEGSSLLRSGSLDSVLRATKERLDQGSNETILIFDEASGRQLDFDFRGSIEEVLERALPKPERRGPGRPRLGVVGGEVTLLPRHWEWLEAQSQGVSATLRRLVDEARKRDEGAGAKRQSLDAAYRFMSVMAGNLPGYEEASRALYRRDRAALEALLSSWPADVARLLLKLYDGA